jgi:hypothetical protein
MSSSRQERLISGSAPSDWHAIDQICGPVVNLGMLIIGIIIAPDYLAALIAEKA